MKTFLLGLLLLFSLSSADWMTDFAKAKEQAIREKKVILLNFSGSDWCGPCIKMRKEIFETGKFQTFAGDNLVLVRADFPRLKKISWKNHSNSTTRCWPKNTIRTENSP